MSEIIFYLHHSYEKLKFLIENTSKDDLNKHTALSISIKERCSLKIIELLLLLKGCDPNMKTGIYSKCPLFLACKTMKQNDDYGINLYELLLHYGADIHNMDYDHFFEYLLFVIQNNIEPRLIPIIYQKSSPGMISKTVNKLIFLILGSDESELTNYMKVMEIIFLLRDQRIENDFNIIYHLYTQGFTFSKDNYTRKLIEIVISNMFRNGFDKDSTFMSLNINCFYEKLLSRDVSRVWKEIFSKIFLEELKNIWFKCFEQCEKMKKDVLSNGCTVLKVMQTPNVADAYCMYKLLLRLNEYSYFKSILSYRVKEYNHIIKLYDVINYYHPSILSVDVFAHLSKYISKDDIFNILLASIPKC